MKLNPKGEITYITPSINTLGYNQQELLNKPLTNLIKDQDKTEIINLMNGHSNYPSPLMKPLQMKRKNSSFASIEVNASHLYNDGEISGEILVMRDVTDRNKYRDRLETLYSHASYLSDAQDLDEIAEITILTINNLLGYETIGFGIVTDEKLMFPYVNGIQNKTGPTLSLNGPGITVRAVKTGQTQLVDNTTKDPDYIPLEGSNDDLFSEIAVPIKHGAAVKGVLCIQHPEVSKFSEGDKKLLELLVGRVGFELARVDNIHELEEECSELRKIDVLKNRFISMASHELKTPVNSIMGYAELLASEFEEDENSNVHDMLEVIKRNVERLYVFSQDLTDAQVLRTGDKKLNIHQFDVLSLIENAVDEMRPIVDLKRQKIVVNTRGDVSLMYGDEMRLSQVIVNLLGNASKFSLEGQSIHLDVFGGLEDIRFSVRDSGVGLSEEDMKQLFEPFPMIKKPKGVKGTGLGLTICKGIIDLHGGHIKAESEGIGKGSTFTFNVPYSQDRIIE